MSLAQTELPWCSSLFVATRDAAQAKARGRAGWGGVGGVSGVGGGRSGVCSGVVFPGKPKSFCNYKGLLSFFLALPPCINHVEACSENQRLARQRLATANRFRFLCGFLRGNGRERTIKGVEGSRLVLALACGGLEVNGCFRGARVGNRRLNVV